MNAATLVPKIGKGEGNGDEAINAIKATQKNVGHSGADRVTGSENCAETIKNAT